MSFIDLTPPPNFHDRAWQAAYRFGFPMARTWWRLRQRPHEGALVAVYVGRKLLLVRSSYRSKWSFPGGGVRPGETPAQAAQRELLEEVGLAASVIGPAQVVNGIWDCRPDQVHVFRLRLDQPPTLQLDNREVVAARLFSPAELDQLPMIGPVNAYLRLHSGDMSPLPT